MTKSIQIQILTDVKIKEIKIILFKFINKNQDNIKKTILIIFKQKNIVKSTLNS